MVAVHGNMLLLGEYYSPIYSYEGRVGESRLFSDAQSSELEWFDLFSSSSELAFFILRLAFANHVDTCMKRSKC